MKKTTLVLLLLPLFTFAQANKFFRQGMRATDFNEQIDLFSQAIELEPQHLDAYFQRAIAKDNIGDYNGAILDYTKVIFYEPDADPYYNRGNSKYKLNDFAGAGDDYAKAIEIDPQFYEARYSLGCVKYDLEDYEGAIEELIKVVKVFPENYDAIKQIAFAYSALKKSVEALRYFSLAILINPSSEAFYNRGASFMDINYYKKANDDFTTAIKIDKTNTLAYFFKGTSHFFLGEYDKAISDFNIPINFDSLDYDAIFGLALTYYKMGDLENAKSHFEKAQRVLKSFNENKESMSLFENTYWFLNQYYTFYENYQKLAEL